MTLLFSKYYKTTKLLKTFDDYRDEIIKQRNERVEVIKTAAEEFRRFHREAQVEALSDENRSKLLEQAAKKQKEARSLETDLNSWLNRRQSAIDEKKAMEFVALRKEILAIIQKLGNEEGYDFIFDLSGNSIAGVNVLVYTKDATDLTGILLEKINENAPKEETKTDE